MGMRVISGTSALPPSALVPRCSLSGGRHAAAGRECWSRPGPTTPWAGTSPVRVQPSVLDVADHVRLEAVLDPPEHRLGAALDAHLAVGRADVGLHRVDA